MDNTVINTISLFSGVGMLDEGLHAGLGFLGIRSRTVMYAEREAYPVSVLEARMEEGSLPPAPIWFGDLCELDASQFHGVVDCIAAGFPCQDLSLAGRRAGLDGKRSGLFFEVVRIARDCGARYLFLENVAGIASASATVVDEAEGALDERAAARVLGELADLGWNAEWVTISASDIGASHGRARWFCWAWRLENPVSHGAPKRPQEQRGDAQGIRAPKCAGDSGDAGTAMDDAKSRSLREHQHHQRESAGNGNCPTSAGDELADTSSTGREGREQLGALHGNRGGRKHMDQLSNFVSHSSHQAQPTQPGPESSGSGPTSPRRLNPAFTAWLMGWPTTWTTAAPSASSAAATESWRLRHRLHLSDLCGGCANENALPDLQQADAQTGCDTGSGRNRAGVRREGCAAPTPWTSQENSADSRETASAGCL